MPHCEGLDAARTRGLLWPIEGRTEVNHPANPPAAEVKHSQSTVHLWRTWRQRYPNLCNATNPHYTTKTCRIKTLDCIPHVKFMTVSRATSNSWGKTVMLGMRFCKCYKVTPVYAVKAYREGMGPVILNLGTRRRWEVSFLNQPLYPQQKNVPCPTNRRLGGTKSRSENFGPDKNLVPVGHRIPDSPARRLLTPTTLSPLERRNTAGLTSCRVRPEHQISLKLGD